MRGVIRIGDVLLGAGTRHPEWHFTSFYGWLKQEGFFCKDGQFYFISDRVARVCSLRDIGDYIEGNLFYERSKSGKVLREYSDHLEMYNRNKSRYINEKNLLLSLGEYKGKMLRDDKDHAYFPFLNGIVVVTRKECLREGEQEIELKSYEQVLGKDMVVYDGRIIKREVSLVGRDLALMSDFANFCRRAIDGEDNMVKGYKYLYRAIGYMLHMYKDPATAKMVFFSDCNNAYGISEGRTGKSLIAQVALRQLRNLSVIDGKQFDYKDRFMLDTVSDETDIVCMQDMRNGFNQETLYNLITGDFQIGKKYQAKTVIPFSQAPKIIADSNFSVKLNGGSDFARIIVIGFGHYFNYRNTPADHYKKRFFDDWNTNDFNKFYSFMFNCVKDYFNFGVQSYRLNELVAYSVYNRYPMDLCLEIKDILSSGDDFLLEQMESKHYWERIGYFESLSVDISNQQKLKLLTDVMREFGYVKHSATKTKHVTRAERELGLKDTKVMLHWFEKVASGRRMEDFTSTKES